MAAGILWLLALAWAGLYAHCALRQQTAIVHGWPPRVVLAQGQFMVQLRSAARSLMKDIEARYPARVPRLARILPWNWSVEPSVPGASGQTVRSIRGLRQGRLGALDVQSSALEPHLTALAVSPAAAAQFLDALRDAQRALPQPPSRVRLWLVGPSSDFGISGALLVCLMIFMLGFGSYLLRRMAGSYWRVSAGRAIVAHAEEAMLSPQWLLVSGFVHTGLFLLYAYSVTLLLFVYSSQFLVALGVTMAAFLGCETLALVRLPRNPYMALVEHLKPTAGVDPAAAAS